MHLALMCKALCALRRFINLNCFTTPPHPLIYSEKILFITPPLPNFFPHNINVHYYEGRGVMGSFYVGTGRKKTSKLGGKIIIIFYFKA